MISVKERYQILPDHGAGYTMIFDAETGTMQSPPCWQDLTAYYHYLLGRGRIKESQTLLEESMKGGKPITAMVTRTSGDAISRP